jgi:hypothetical protein
VFWFLKKTGKPTLKSGKPKMESLGQLFLTGFWEL